MPSLSTTSPTDNIRRYYTESFNKITSHAIITDGKSVGNYVGNFKIITDGKSVGNYVGNFKEITDGFIPSVMFPRETFFLARAYPFVLPSVGDFFYLRHN